MGIFKDITDTVKDIRDELKGVEGDYLTQKRYSSIAKQSMEGTLQFPILISRSLDLGTSQIITKALEREFASFAQIVLSMNPYLDLKKDKNVAGYLRNFHQNTGNVRTTSGDFTLENATALSNDDETLNGLFVTCEGATRKVIGENRKQLESILEHVNMNKLNDLYIPQEPVVRFKNGELSEYYNSKIEPLTEAKRQTKVSYKSGNNNIEKSYIYDDDTEKNYKLQQDKFRYQKQQDKLNRAERSEKDRIAQIFNQDKFEFEKGKDKRNYDQKERQMANQRSEFNRKMKFEEDKFAAMNRGVKLSDNDAKKANELVPTMMNLSLNVKEDGNFGGVINCMIGIKAVLHPINNDEMVNNIVAGCKNSNKFFNFIRWTSGETTFLKDFILNVSEIKNDVYNKSKGASHWWTTLKRRKTWAKNKHRLMVLAGGGKRILPNATIVITMEEVEYIKNNYGFDLMSINMVDKIMKEYFLLSFVIVDSSLEVAHFLFDGQLNFQSVSFNGLEKENNSKNDFKEVMKMVNNSRL